MLEALLAPAVQLLHDLPQLQRADPQLVDALRTLKFVSTPNGALAAPAQMYDPRYAPCAPHNKHAKLASWQP